MKAWRLTVRTAQVVVSLLGAAMQFRRAARARTWGRAAAVGEREQS